MGFMKFAITPGFGVGGTIFSSEQLAILGSIVGGDAKIELTTFKQLYVEMQEDRFEEVKQSLKETGFELHPAGFYTKSLITCNFCKGADEAGLSIAKTLDKAISGIPTPSPLKIGFSGCALATGEPLLKDIGVVKMRTVFDIYVGGEGKTLKARLGKLFLSGVTEDELVPIILRLIHYFQEHVKKRETFNRFINRITIEKLKEVKSEQ